MPHHLNADLALVLPAFGAASCSYTCAQYGLDAVQLALVFFLGPLAHSLTCTQINRHILQLALCGGGDVLYFLMW